MQFDSSVTLGPIATRDYHTISPDISRQLVDFSIWKDGNSLILNREYSKLPVATEFRIRPKIYPLMLIVKETVGQPNKFHYFYICQEPMIWR